jgi:thermostable 8-oxoguanine DNA glycosylase
MNKITDRRDDLSEFLKGYQYQPGLTKYLDGLDAQPFGQGIVNEIVLWEVNRYAPLGRAALEALNSVVDLESGSHRSTFNVIAALLLEQGVDLPMASTFLRFRNPRVFQIIDRHAYRAISGNDYPLYPGSKDGEKIELYLRYLDDLVDLARSKNLEFRTLDRLLYMFDKKTNGKL